MTGCVPAAGGRQAGIIVGSILGSLLLLSLLGLLIWALTARYQRKECQRACSDCRWAPRGDTGWHWVVLGCTGLYWAPVTGTGH